MAGELCRPLDDHFVQMPTAEQRPVCLILIIQRGRTPGEAASRTFKAAALRKDCFDSESSYSPTGQAVCTVGQSVLCWFGFHTVALKMHPSANEQLEPLLIFSFDEVIQLELMGQAMIVIHSHKLSNLICKMGTMTGFVLETGSYRPGLPQSLGFGLSRR